MTNDEKLLKTDDSEIKRLSASIADKIVSIVQQHPELVTVKYHNINWSHPKYQSALITEINKKISNIVDYRIFLPKIKEFLEILLVPLFFTSPAFQELESFIIELSRYLILNKQNNFSNVQVLKNEQKTFISSGIAILLLDAENLRLNTTAEQFLTTVCTYPLQVKIAFANWCSMGKRDVELHQRGYELIHVPVGRDNADGKMIALGSSVHQRYANVQEVIVCSSDQVMTNLCNHLQQYGLIIYQVYKQEEVLKIFNSSNGKEIAIPNSLDIPPVNKFIQQIKQLIKIEQDNQQIYWVKFSTISQAFKNKYNLSIKEVINQHFPDKKAKDVFLAYANDFVVHQVDSKSELYITVFSQYPVLEKSLDNHISTINSSADLEQALKAILQELTPKSPKSFIDIGTLGSAFSQRYHQPITEKIKALHLSGNFIKFLQSCNSFNLQQTDKRWQVALR